MGELPIFTANAHVFTIDPKTKKTWIPSSTKAVEINYFFDPTKNCFRIVSIEDTNSGKQVIINSTLTEKMVFKKTSQKFGQWSDSKQSTIFGLGFNSEEDLDGFVNQFKSCIDSMRSKLVQNQMNISNSKETGKRELLGLNNNVVGLTNSGRQWATINSSTSPNLNNNNSKIISLETELEKMSKKYDELKLQHQEEVQRLHEEFDSTNNGTLMNTADNFKTIKDLKLRIIELETENKELKKKLSESKPYNHVPSLLNVHQQIDSCLKQLSNYHCLMGQKLSDILTTQTSDVKPPSSYGL